MYDRIEHAAQHGHNDQATPQALRQAIERVEQRRVGNEQGRNQQNEEVGPGLAVHQ